MIAKLPLQLRAVLALLCGLSGLFIASGAQAHPAPYSYLNLSYEDGRIAGEVIVHTNELAGSLDIADPEVLLDKARLEEHSAAIQSLLFSHIAMSDGRGAFLTPASSKLEPAVDDAALRLIFTTEAPPPSALTLDISLFQENPNHSTFVNIYEDNALVEQFLFGQSSKPRTYYAGSVSGTFAAFANFVPSGIHHVLIGADHILFIVGLILMGGTWRRLLLIVSAFTLGHSVTLGLAGLDIYAPPAWIIEPLIALSIVIVGLDNLMRGKGRDLRPVFAVLFGLIHGFGFAFVFAKTGLSQSNLIAPLLAFNLGVELGQLAIVLPLSLLLAFLRLRFDTISKRITLIGSLAVIAAGAYWFVDRVLSMGGV